MTTVNPPTATPERPRPRALAPTQQVLARFSVQDREIINRLLTEPLECVLHPSFADPATAQALFGAQAERPAAPRAWCNIYVAETATLRSSEPVTLSTAQEQLLFQQVNYARHRIWEIFRRVGARRLSAGDVAELLMWKNRAENARIELVEANMPLVLAMAKRARLGNIDYAELISEGNMALLRSVDKFDCSRGFKFSTYACRAILKSFSRVAIRTSRYRGRFPTEFDPTLEKSDHMDRARDATEASYVGELKDILLNNLADLTKIEHQVLEARFALGATPLDGENPPAKTLEQVGELIGVTKERVRQIQNKALLKLKAALEGNTAAA